MRETFAATPLTVAGTFPLVGPILRISGVKPRQGRGDAHVGRRPVSHAGVHALIRGCIAPDTGVQCPRQQRTLRIVRMESPQMDPQRLPWARATSALGNEPDPKEAIHHPSTIQNTGILPRAAVAQAWARAVNPFLGFSFGKSMVYAGARGTGPQCLRQCIHRGAHERLQSRLLACFCCERRLCASLECWTRLHLQCVVSAYV